MDIELTIRRAIGELGLENRVTELAAADAAKAVAAAEKKFVTKPGVRWWWEALNEHLPVSQCRMGQHGYKLIEPICPEGPAWLFASDDEFPPWPVYLGSPADFVRIIGECHCFEYIVVSPSLEWLVIENHHDCVIAVGEPVATRLATSSG